MEKIEEYSYTKKDFRIEWFSGTGPGGQNRNKTKNCVRITHIPSGLKASSQTHRDRRANFRDAFQRLGKLIEAYIRQQIKTQFPERRISTTTIRTYHAVDNRVTDHLSGFQTSYSHLEKNFEELMMARHKAVNEKNIKD